MGFSAEQVRRYREDGFLVVEGLYSPAELVRMTDAVEGILADLREEARAGDERAKRSLQIGVYVGLTLRRPYLREAFRKPDVVERLRALTSPKVGFLSDKIVFKSEEVSFPTPWHQDHAYWGGSNKVSIWISLDHATVENGCMQFLPKSHLHEVEHDHLDSSVEDGFRERLDLAKVGLREQDAVTVEAEPGSAVFFHDWMLHRSLPNRSGARRRAFITTYRDLSVPDKEYPQLAAAEAIT